jgi:amino acid permease
MILMCSWETALGTSTIGLLNGGTAGLIWMFFFAWLGFLAVNTSMAEMASMAPTAGGQYHWVPEFAPRKHQKFLSYVIGWLCVLGWQTGAANTRTGQNTVIESTCLTSMKELWSDDLPAEPICEAALASCDLESPTPILHFSLGPRSRDCWC